MNKPLVHYAKLQIVYFKADIRDGTTNFALSNNPQAKSCVIISLKHPLSLKYRQIQKYFIKSRVDIEKKL